MPSERLHSGLGERIREFRKVLNEEDLKYWNENKHANVDYTGNVYYYIMIFTFAT